LEKGKEMKIPTLKDLQAREKWAADQMKKQNKRNLKFSEVFDSSKMLKKMFKDCGRPVEFLDCTAEEKCKSTTPNIKRR
jgi:hypothetical protein